MRWHTSSHAAFSIFYISLDLVMLVQEWCSSGVQIGLKRPPRHRIIDDTFVVEVRWVITAIQVEVAAVHFWHSGSMGQWLLIDLRLLDRVQIIAWGERLHALMVLSPLLSKAIYLWAVLSGQTSIELTIVLVRIGHDHHRGRIHVVLRTWK